MTTRKKRMKKEAIHRIQLRISEYLDDRVQIEILDPKKFPSFNRFVEYLVMQYLDHKEIFAEGPDIRPLLEEQKNYFEELKAILQEASALPKPEDYETKEQKIMVHLRTPRTFTDLAALTDVSEAELLVILGNLLNNNIIAYNANWEYFLSKKGGKTN